MTPKVRELLQSCIANKKPDDFVLTHENGDPIREFRQTWRNLCEAVGLGTFTCRNCGKEVLGGGKCKECGCSRPKYSGLIPHDMRRSAAKAARAAGVPESVVIAMGG